MAFVVDRGHLVWLAGRRPAFVLSPKSYNSRAGLLLACPVTTYRRGYPFEVVLPEGLPVSGVVLSDQLESVNWRARKAALICRAPIAVVEEALGKAGTLLATE